MPVSSRQSCYLTLVQPMLEYACAVWSPFTLKNIQEGVRFVCNNFSMYSIASVTAMPSRLNWTSLKDRRDNLR